DAHLDAKANANVNGRRAIVCAFPVPPHFWAAFLRLPLSRLPKPVQLGSQIFPVLSPRLAFAFAFASSLLSLLQTDCTTLHSAYAQLPHCAAPALEPYRWTGATAARSPLNPSFPARSCECAASQAFPKWKPKNKIEPEALLVSIDWELHPSQTTTTTTSITTTTTVSSQQLNLPAARSLADWTTSPTKGHLNQSQDKCSAAVYGYQSSAGLDSA
ncbi:hypothetical protein CCHR01_14633, partial [Colletotrichum chrysophilum]